MVNITYATIIEKAKIIKQGVETKYTLVGSPKWSYYMAKAILTPNKQVKEVNFKEAPNPHGDYISNQIYKKYYLKCAEKLVWYVENRKTLPNFLPWGNRKIKMQDYHYMFSKILVFYDKHKQLPNYNNINSKAYTKPTEYYERIYDYFVQILGKFDNTVDGALSKLDGKGYAGYSDDMYSNKTSIDRIDDEEGINCTDSCHVLMNVIKKLIKLGKYRKVQCIHVGCRVSHTGHVRLRIQLNNGTWIYRDPAAVLAGNGITSNWCMDGELWAYDPDWFLENLNR